jgi:3-methylcrotonyl-CoA carboxylase alpha subunit
MFTKILVANRGEIAMRIMATCRTMGIRTVAVYADADRNALHTRSADEAYSIGPSPAALSYLRMEAIIAAARHSGAQAIHPGYGFLAENAYFVEACEAAGIVFVGPPAAAMRLMGSKIAAKRLAQAVGAPVIPGYDGENQDADVLMREAARIGLPLLIKASAGGGGKGMREVHHFTDFPAQLAGARREALAAFGDDTVFLERLISQPRHIEIQVLADTSGQTIHLGERECSIQRRHQKIVEESPSPALTPALREEMGAAALRIAREAGYVNAGTLEFMLDAQKRFYFLEMNTRLQVEHPVSELVTGIDLVRHQLLIAAGAPLQLTQSEVSPRGHAIEMRLYAEDPEQDFLPSTGTITRFIEPAGPGIRVDSGIASGDEISQFYDPMIAKLIVYAENRTAAIARMQGALEQCAVFGVKTNASLLSTIAAHPAFQKGLTHTAFLLEHRLLETEASQAKEVVPAEVYIAAAFYDGMRTSAAGARPGREPAASMQRGGSPWRDLGPWRMTGEARRITYVMGGEQHSVAFRPTSAGTGAWNVQVDRREAEDITFLCGNEGLVLLRRGVEQARTYVQHLNTTTQVFYRGRLSVLQRRVAPDVATAARGGSSTDLQKMLAAPMAGTIVKVQVVEGDAVQQRQVLVILSAMKMEHTIAAPYAGRVRRLHVQEGEVVKGGAPIVEME